MIDPRIGDNFLNKFFENIIPHLSKINGDAVNGQNEAARDYVRSNDPAHRKQFFSLEARIKTARQMCQAYLDDPAATAQNKDAVYRLFPELLPKITPTDITPTQQTGVVTVTKMGEVPPRPQEAHKGT